MLVTRRILSAFKDFSNPTQAAEEFLNVFVSVNICPELEARIELMQPRKIKKRRFSSALIQKTYSKKPRLSKRIVSSEFQQCNISQSDENDGYDLGQQSLPQIDENDDNFPEQPSESPDSDHTTDHIEITSPDGLFETLIFVFDQW